MLYPNDRAARRKAHNFKPILFEPAAEEKKGKAMRRTTQATTVPSGFYIRGEPGGVRIDAGAASAEGKSLRRFTMTAYTGGAMALSGWPHPVVVDMAGLAVGKKSRPILMDHDTSRIVGHTDVVSTDGGTLTVTGVISGVGSAAQEVIGASDNGFPWQASLGAAVKKVVFVPEDKSATANGKEFAGPVYMVRSARLGEVSFVALGADDSTSAKVEAGRVPAFDGNPCMEVIPMDFEQWVKAKGFELAGLSEEQTANLKAMFEEETGAGKPAEEPEKPPVQAAAGSAANAVFKAREEAENAVGHPGDLLERVPAHRAGRHSPGLGRGRDLSEGLEGHAGEPSPGRRPCGGAQRQGNELRPQGPRSGALHAGGDS
jgi:hypothetical protein